MKYKLAKRFRLPNYDYSSGGYYFITICTKNKIHHFGKIKDDKMVLPKIGRIAEEEWAALQDKYDNIELDIYQVMPDHYHGIIILNGISAEENAPGLQVPLGCVPTTGHSETEDSKEQEGLHPLQKRSLSSIINHYKGAVTKRCKEEDMKFAWQPLYYDRIIRNETELFNIRKYISENPIGWNKD